MEADVVGSILVPLGVDGEAGDEELVRDGQRVDQEPEHCPGCWMTILNYSKGLVLSFI